MTGARVFVSPAFTRRPTCQRTNPSANLLLLYLPPTTSCTIAITTSPSLDNINIPQFLDLPTFVSTSHSTSASIPRITITITITINHHYHHESPIT